MTMLLEIGILNSNSNVDLLMSNNGNMCIKKTIYTQQNKKILQITLVTLSNQLRKTLGKLDTQKYSEGLRKVSSYQKHLPSSINKHYKNALNKEMN